MDDKNTLNHRAELQLQIKLLQEQLKETALYKIGQEVKPDYYKGRYIVSAVLIKWDNVHYNIRKLKKDGTPSDIVYFELPERSLEQCAATTDQS